MFTIKELKYLKQILETTNVHFPDEDMAKRILEKINETLISLYRYDKCLWNFYWDCGRQGCIDSIFKATKEEVEAAYGKTIYFGEILGKHSEIFGELEECDIKLISDNPVEVINAQ